MNTPDTDPLHAIGRRVKPPPKERYVIVYRDGLVSDPHSWDQVLFFVGLARRIPWPLKPVQVVDLVDLTDRFYGRLIDQRIDRRLEEMSA